MEALLVLLLGYLLAKEGFSVIILDKNDLFSNTTTNTTAKITSQHGLIYSYLKKSFGYDFAKKYFEANQKAIEDIEIIIKSENIDCDFKRESAFVYTQDTNNIPKINEEIKCLQSFGYHTDMLTNIALPIKILAAIEMKNQASFNPAKYCMGLLKSILLKDGKVFSNSPVFSIHKDNGIYNIRTPKGEISAKHLVISSHYPLKDIPGFYFVKMYQESSYIVALDTNENLFDGMYISCDDNVVSFRTIKNKDTNLLLVGGSKHRTGLDKDLKNSYSELENIGKKMYKNSNLKYFWEAEDCVTLDKVPYIGDFSKFMPQVYVATGFNKWGMTTSNVAANILKDKILGIKNEYEDVYNSYRFGPFKNRKELGSIMLTSINSLAINRFKVKKEDISDIPKDTGKIISYKGRKMAVYKDIHGKVFSVSPFCTHLGCLLTFNNLDKTWDCPCHGSRFTHTGKSICDPSVHDLEQYTL